MGIRVVNDLEHVSLDTIRDPQGDVAVITVHGRKRLNLVGVATVNRCAAVVSELAQDENIRCAILQGRSADAFIGGADLNEIQALEMHNATSLVGGIHAFCTTLREFPVPVIARISGYCLGAGLEIAAACDLRVCDQSARFGMPEVQIGVPSVVEAALLPQLIGWGKTRELVYRGHIIDAREAEKIGLVEHCDDSDLDAAVATLVQDILSAAPQAIRLQKQLCREWEGLSPDAAIVAGLASFARAYESDEPQRYCQRFFDRVTRR